MPVDAPEAGPSRSIPIDWQEAAGTEASGDSEPFHSNIFPHSDQKLRWERRATPDSSLNPSRQARVDLLFWRRFRRLLSVCLQRHYDRWLLGLALPVLIALCLLSSYRLLLAPGRIYATLVDGSSARFRMELARLFELALLVAVLRTLRGTLGEWMANRWRWHLTRHLHARYLSPTLTDFAMDAARPGERVNGRLASPYHPSPATVPPLYLLTRPTHRIENPDQRMVTEVRLFCQTCLALLAGTTGSGGLLEGAATLAWYSVAAAYRTGWRGVVVVYGWSALSIAASWMLANITAPAIYRQEVVESSFRYHHVHVRDRAEAMSMLGAGADEWRHLNRLLLRVVRAAATVIRRHAPMNAANHCFAYLAPLTAYAIVGAALFYGDGATTTSAAAERAEWISQTASVLIQLLYAFTTLIHHDAQLSELAAYVSRLGGLHEALPRSRRGGCVMTSDANELETVERSPPLLQVQEADLVVPDTGLLLLRQIDLRIIRGAHTLILGRSGSGKTSLMRALRGLWPLQHPRTAGVCACRLPLPTTVAGAASGVLFLGAEPDLPVDVMDGALAGLIAYPSPTTGTPDEHSARVSKVSPASSWRLPTEVEMQQLLQRVGLARLLPRYPQLNGPRDWSAALSHGEQQLLCMARLLWHQPALAVLDEALRGADSDAAAEALSSAMQCGITVLYLSEPHTSLSPLFPRHLMITDDQRLLPVEPARA
ncbi:hypothetical protein CDCA_CDCA01G0091 [Cyanidium caldarium]|uniref:ABC transporter domain-containing protein n=1 Tax=Cyanidium caldarium TaxID=2771 RepID=A0AAV9IPD2_CYACA|nr:hypothetical protein CDCA_CDCA01G0091 [Cyanidium caldarium]